MPKLIGFGGENIVYKLDKNKVAKRPFGIRYFVNPHETVNEVIADLKVLQVYFKDYLSPTEITSHKSLLGIQSYTMTQKYIKGSCLRKASLKEPKVLNQLQEIMNINEYMLQSENKSYEFFGVWTLLFSHVLKKVSNIIVEENTNKLYIIDVGVLYLGKGYHSGLLQLIYMWAYRKQKKLLQGLLN